MEDSMSMNSNLHQNPVVSKTTTAGDHSGSPHLETEESGWTAYFEDSSNNNINREEEEEENSNHSSFVGTPSLVSDAASCVARRLSKKHHAVAATPTNKMPMELQFKKPRTNQISDDDSLEDTASSPVSSPKGKGGALEHYSELQQKEISMNLNIGHNASYRFEEKKAMLGSFVHFS